MVIFTYPNFRSGSLVNWIFGRLSILTFFLPSCRHYLKWSLGIFFMHKNDLFLLKKYFFGLISYIPFNSSTISYLFNNSLIYFTYTLTLCILSYIPINSLIYLNNIQLLKFSIKCIIYFVYPSTLYFYYFYP